MVEYKIFYYNKILYNFCVDVLVTSIDNSLLILLLFYKFWIIVCKKYNLFKLETIFGNNWHENRINV